VTYLYEQITMIVVHDVLAYPRTLRLPVTPYSKRAVMDAVMMDMGIYCSMEFYSRNFITEKFMFQCNIIYMVVMDFTEDTSEMPYYTVLPAIVNGIVADNVGTYCLLAPALAFCGKD